MGQMLAKDRFTLKEAAMTARRSRQLTLNNDIKAQSWPGRYDETFGSLCRTLSGFTAAGAKPMANGLATLICVMTLERVGWAPLAARGIYQQQNQAQAEQQMIKATDRKLVVGLEIGTAKVAALVGEVLPDGMVNIIGGQPPVTWYG